MGQSSSHRRPKVVLIPWGTVIEDYLDPIGRSLAEFRTQMTGGWLFNYVQALQLAGVDPVILVFSAEARHVDHAVHEPTGVPFITHPATSIARLVHKPNPRRSGGDLNVGGRQPRAKGFLRSIILEASRYLSTPAGLLAHTLRESGASAVLCQDYEWERFDIIVRVGRRLGIPVFGIFQGGSLNAGFISRVVRSSSIRNSAGLIIGSRREVQRVRTTYGIPASAIGEFPNPIPFEEVKVQDARAARSELEIPGDAFVVGWHGRVELHAKGLDLLAAAWHQLVAEASDRPRVLLMIGSGTHDEQLRELLGPRLRDGSIRWLNEYTTDRSRIYHYLSAANVYVFPSRKEGFPVAPQEAMALGLPIVAAQAHGIDEIAPNGEADGAIRIPADDANALAHVLSDLSRDPDRVARLGAAAQRRIAEGFAMKPVGRAMRAWLHQRGLQHRESSASP